MEMVFFVLFVVGFMLIAIHFGTVSFINRKGVAPFDYETKINPESIYFVYPTTNKSFLITEKSMLPICHNQAMRYVKNNDYVLICKNTELSLEGHQLLSIIQDGHRPIDLSIDIYEQIRYCAFRNKLYFDQSKFVPF